MKKNIFFALILLFTFQNYGFSQSFNFIKGLKKADMMLGFTLNDWQSPAAPVETKLMSSRGFDLAFIKRFGGEAVNFGFGLGLSNINIHSNIHPWNFNVDGSVDSFRVLTKAYDKNKLSLTYLEIPLELKFKFAGKDENGNRKKKGLVIAPGFRAGIAIDAHTKVVSEDTKQKYKDFNFINRLRYGPTVRIGYGAVSLFGRYDLTSTFDGDNIPKYNVFSFGVYLGANN